MTRSGAAVEPAPTPRGVRLGIDVGSVRVGVAISDPGGILATPVGTLARDTSRLTDIAEVTALVQDREVVEVVIGLPRSLSGKSGAAVEAARAYGRLVSERVAPVPVVFVDERLTSVTANRVMAERGVKQRNRRAVVDQIAAVEILQSRLDALSRTAAR